MAPQLDKRLTVLMILPELLIIVTVSVKGILRGTFSFREEAIAVEEGLQGFLSANEQLSYEPGRCLCQITIFHAGRQSRRSSVRECKDRQTIDRRRDAQL